MFGAQPMKKIKLDLSDLRIESFDTAGASSEEGTVFGQVCTGQSWCTEDDGCTVTPGCRGHSGTCPSAGETLCDYCNDPTSACTNPTHIPDCNTTPFYC
jgi:hypothetical protein